MIPNLTLQDFWLDKSHHYLMLITTFGYLSKGLPHVWLISTIIVLEKATFAQKYAGPIHCFFFWDYFSLIPAYKSSLGMAKKLLTTIPIWNYFKNKSAHSIWWLYPWSLQATRSLPINWKPLATEKWSNFWERKSLEPLLKFQESKTANTKYKAC